MTSETLQPSLGPLRQVARRYRWQLLATYSLFGLETLAGLAQPLTLGLAVNDLLAGTALGLWLFAGQQLLALGLGVVRRAYDTRLFTLAASELAERLVLEQRAAGVALSQVAARAGLSRQLVDFFERDLPFVFHCVAQGVGAVVMLALVASAALPYCLAALLVAGMLGRVYGRYAQHWNQGLHDELEQSVSVIAHGSAADIGAHYRSLSRWQVRLSDGEALYFGLWQALALVLTAAILVQSGRGDNSAGQITMVLGYVQMLLTTLVNLPRVIDQGTRLCDICRRMEAG